MADAAVTAITSWTFLEECPIPADIPGVLANGEVPHVAFKTLRDSAVFTNKRLIVRDAQGLTGKKVEVYSLPYSSINMWSSENAGKMLDFNAELELWTRAGHVKIKIGRNLDVRALDRLIANCVLG
ncbi:PH domain-containing protein [Corynebacterium suedekumii]|nr:PH domain-containing protein [Corynebacterium suedekumii]